MVFRLAVLLLAVLCAAAPVRAQDDPAPEARRAYSQGLADVRSLIEQGQLEAAAKRVDTLLAQRPREAQARFFKGVIDTRRGDAKAAIATFEALVADYPELPEPYNNLAVLYAARGDLESARTALETALRTEPGFALAHENLGDILARIAATHYDRAAQLDRANKSAAAKLALARELLARGSAAAP